MSSYLSADVRVVRAEHTTQVALDVPAGSVVAVIGPNGAGKTTFLRALAGVVPLTSGHVRVDGHNWHGLPIRRRHVGMVFQDRLLFPHLSAVDNVAFGLRSRGVRRGEARARSHDWLKRLGIGDLAARRPDELSGGQAQRVAIARALAGEPALLLLDEPLAALDVGVAAALRVELSRHLADFPGVAVLVTHDAIDALTLATHVLVIDDGRLVQSGTPDEVTRQPRTGHVARLLGLNVLRGRAEGTTVHLDSGRRLETATRHDGVVNACFAPSAVTVTLSEPTGGSARNRWQGVVRAAVPHADTVRLHVDIGGESGDEEHHVDVIADVTAAAVADLLLAPGRTVWLSVKATEVQVQPTGDLVAR